MYTVKKILLVVLSTAILMSVGLSIPFAQNDKQTKADEVGIQKGKELSKFKLFPLTQIYQHEEGMWLDSPRGIFYDEAKGEIYVADTRNNLVAIFDRDGYPLFSFGYNGELIEPSGVMTDKRGRIYVLTGAPKEVKVFNYRVEFIRKFPFDHIDNSDESITVSAMTAGANGNLYFAESNGDKRIMVYDIDYNLLKVFGTEGRGEGEFLNIMGIDVDDDGKIYVSDGLAIPVQVFDKDGNFLRGWGEHATGPQNFSLPGGIAVSKSGLVMVLDTIRQDIKFFTLEGRFLANHGGLGIEAGAVAFPIGIDADATGRVYVTEKVGNRFQIFEARKPTNEEVTERIRIIKKNEIARDLRAMNVTDIKAN